MSSYQPWWQLTQGALASGDWPTAEGALRRLLAMAPDKPELLDLLGYALLMQGAFASCEATLREAMAKGSRSFWTPHKLGDALRGQQRMAEAIDAYEMALGWGSDSPLTARNLLQVLDGMAPAQALARLEAWAGESGDKPATAPNWTAPPPWLQGALEAALTSTGLELALWLHGRGCPDGSICQLVLQEAVLRFELGKGLGLAEGPLRQRLGQLLAPADLELA